MPSTYFILNFANHLLLFRSNTDEKAPVFELVAGRTDQTNKQQTFLLTPHGNTAYIRMARPMDYESISEYTLTVRIQVCVLKKV